MVSGMATPSGFKTYNRLTDGKLEQIIRTERLIGQSYKHIESRLRDELGIDVDRDTVRRWDRDFVTGATGE